MARIKKQGLDYFPIGIDFMQNRLVRRILKREGDGALAALLAAYSAIYGGNGYYVNAGDDFCADIADSLYTLDPSDVERIVALAVEYGLFDTGLYRSYGILTSADIQRQYLFITRRRNLSVIDSRYCLVAAAELAGDAPSAAKASAETATEAAAEAAAETATEAAPEGAESAENSDLSPINATLIGINAEKAHFGTQSKANKSTANKSTAKQIKENPLLKASPETGGDPAAADGAAGGGAAGAARRKPSYDTLADIDRLTPPADGIPRNLDGLRFCLRQFGVPPREQYAIILKSNFGAIGHPMWKGFEVLRTSHGKIRLPGHYLLSLCK